MSEREHVIDFTVPYYDLVGITIMMKKPKVTDWLVLKLSLFGNFDFENSFLVPSWSFDYLILWLSEEKSVLYLEELKEYKYKADDTSMGSFLPSKASNTKAQIFTNKLQKGPNNRIFLGEIRNVQALYQKMIVRCPLPSSSSSQSWRSQSGAASWFDHTSMQ